jgi:hypothetical protein
MKSFVIEYVTHDGSYSSSQAIGSFSDLEKAQTWLKNEPKGKPWENLAYIEGSGNRMRLVTDFSNTHWTEYVIREVPLNEQN